MATVEDFSLSSNPDGTLSVSSHLTQGRTATIWFDLHEKPHVMWAVIPSYRNGLTDALILDAVARSAPRP